MSAERKTATCACAHHNDGSVTTYLCPAHAEDDPCATKARWSGKRRRGSVIRGVCSACGWSALSRSCEGCGAVAGEPCRPDCLSSVSP